MCRELEACVHCQAFDSSSEHCKDCNFDLDFLENDFIEKSSHQFEPESPCVARTSFDCKYKYSGETNQHIFNHSKQNYKPYTSVKLNVTNVWVVLHTFDGTREICSDLVTGLSLGAGALVLLIGLLSIFIYKCCIVIDDRRQYANFRKEVENMKSGVNQNASELYKSPITRFENPMFGKG